VERYGYPSFLEEVDGLDCPVCVYRCCWGAAWVALADNKATRRARVVAILVAFASIAAVADGFRTGQKNEQFQSEMRIKAEETLKQLTGGEGVCEVGITVPATGTAAELYIVNLGDYPLYDVSMIISDIEAERRDKASGISRSFFDYTAIIPPFNIGPKQVSSFRPSWRNGEIWGGRVLRASSLDKVLSSRFARNELMRLCLLRWQDERHLPTFQRC
jgi:hypothetical protein